MNRNLKDKDLFSKSDPMCVLYFQEFGSTSFIEFGRTEQVVNSFDPEFTQKFEVDYHFEESQKMKFEIYDADSSARDLSAHDFLGRAEITLGELMSSAGSKLHLQLKGVSGKCGSLILGGEEISNSKNEYVYLQFKAIKLDNKDTFGKSDPFLHIYRKNESESNDLVFRSEVIKNSLNPVWKPMPTLALRQLCYSNYEHPIRIECYDHDNDGGDFSSHDLIGTCEVTMLQLLDAFSNQHSFDLINPKKLASKKHYKNSGRLEVILCKVEEAYSFLDFIRGGTQVNFTVAVDFTASNGDPNKPESLHYIHPYSPNSYMIALKSVGEICQDYDSDKMFPALGFGARLPPNGTLSFEFFLNFHPTDPNVHGIDGVLGAYRNALLNVQLYGPTNFAPVINHVARIASTQNNNSGSNYFILLIITDGAISDMAHTKEAITMASWLPMSIIIVGVGNADFSAMEALDADKGILEQGGKVAARDIVQFVEFNKYLQNDNFQLCQARLAKDVLSEIPTQLCGFMRMKGVKPKPPRVVDVDQLQPMGI